VQSPNQPCVQIGDAVRLRGTIYAQGDVLTGDPQYGSGEKQLWHAVIGNNVTMDGAVTIDITYDDNDTP
jgi:hypothetical protein